MSRNGRFTLVLAALSALLAAAPAAAQGEKGKGDRAQGGARKAEKVVAGDQTAWQPLDPKQPDGPQMAILWGSPKQAPYGFLLKVKAGTEFPRHSHTADYDAVVVQGEWKHTFTEETDTQAVPAGSHWHQAGKKVHGDACASTSGECIVLVSLPRGKHDFIPAPEGKQKKD